MVQSAENGVCPFSISMFVWIKFGNSVAVGLQSDTLFADDLSKHCWEMKRRY